MPHIIFKEKIVKKPVNENYCANVVSIKSIIPLEGMNTIAHTNIFGNLVIVSKDTPTGTIGLFFPIETALSKDFLSNNNLFRKSDLNVDQTKKGFFEENGRIKALKLQGNKSMGFFIPLSSLDYTNHKEELKEGDIFDEINGKKICEKYVVTVKNLPSQGNKVSKSNKQIKRISKMIMNQFRFHEDTAQLGKNIHKVKDFDLIHISQKLHGTSFVVSNVLCKRKLNLIEKFLMKLGVKINDTQYDNVYSSRKVIKNEDLNPGKNDFYKIDIWKAVNDKLKDKLSKGMTIYGEAVGYLPGTDSRIQRGYEYNYAKGEFGIYIYRITFTNTDGQVFEFSAKQVKDWCRDNGENAVPELYYGYAIDLYNTVVDESKFDQYEPDLFLEGLQKHYLEKDANTLKPPYISCKKNVPDEGVVLRLEKNTIEAYKLKSFKFYEYETKEADAGLSNIEDLTIDGDLIGNSQ